MSRNFTVGYRLAQGERLSTILDTMEEVAEGVNTVQVAKRYAAAHDVKVPITEVLHRILFEGLSVKDGLQMLMKFPYNVDIDFL